jgi:antitoxin (DNA-binding transcriptional repressor) of toxin-antitoxin stability system
MPREITQRELRNGSGDIMRALDRGESFVVTRNGVPVGELIPVRRRRFVATEAALAVFAGAPRIDVARFRADLSTAEWTRGRGPVRDRGLIDTSVVIELERIEPAALPRELAVSSVTLAELAAGPRTTHTSACADRTACSARRPCSIRFPSTAGRRERTDESTLRSEVPDAKHVTDGSLIC